MSEESGQRRNSAVTRKNDTELERIGTEVAGVGASNAYPDVYFPKEPAFEQRLQAKQTLKTALDRHAPIDKEEVDWLMRKRQGINRMNFDHWFTQQLNLHDITQLQKAQEFYPEFFEAREQVIETVGEMQKRYAKIKLRGPKNLDDFHLIYALQQYHGQTGDYPYWFKKSVIDWDTLAGGGKTEKSYISGMWSPRSWAPIAQKSPFPINVDASRGILNLPDGTGPSWPVPINSVNPISSFSLGGLFGQGASQSGPILQE